MLDDLRGVLKDALATTGFATAALRRLTGELESVPRTPGNLDPTVFVLEGDPNRPGARAHASWRLSEALKQLSVGGPVEVRLGQQWIVFMFSMWEQEFRPRLARAHGVPLDDIRYPLLGDLRRLRNDVVHHRGIATTQNAGGCEVLGHWFALGQPIALSGKHFVEFVDLFPWTEMAAGPQ